jgi:hypothetical protein
MDIEDMGNCGGRVGETTAGSGNAKPLWIQGLRRTQTNLRAVAGRRDLYATSADCARESAAGTALGVEHLGAVGLLTVRV